MSQLSSETTTCCDLCRSSDKEIIRDRDRHGDPLPSVICRNCGLVWTDPRPTPEQLRQFYAREYRLNYKGLHEPSPRHLYRAARVAADRYRRIRSALPAASRIADVGAGGGEVVYVLRAMGHDATGLEPNEGYARFAAETLGLPVSTGFWQDAAIEPESLDAVTIFHAVEHLESPGDAVARFREWLKPGGILVVEVPNSEATCQQPHSQFHPGHLHHFNLATMEALHRREGFDIVSGTTSPDGGNITVISRKTSRPAQPCPGLPGNYERVAGILRGHTALKHFFTPHPWLRPLRKLAQRMDEKRNAKAGSAPKELLDDVIRRELNPA